MAAGDTRMMSLESVIRGYHIMKENWTPREGDTLCKFDFEVEELNQYNCYANNSKNDETMGHGKGMCMYKFLGSPQKVKGLLELI